MKIGASPPNTPANDEHLVGGDSAVAFERYTTRWWLPGARVVSIFVMSTASRLGRRTTAHSTISSVGASVNGPMVALNESSGLTVLPVPASTPLLPPPAGSGPPPDPPSSVVPSIPFAP